ncbi:oligosaccharide flippase family protein [Phycicoccus sp. HDW14]|uniref:lipopolysaccharide biosynthesis protein n=1 Tax=Phycicoccus sp. HDW14 TaxID=2714941 RepID=UPI00140CDB9C|nr:oligosaccharide flippase family protein [Phycicoccus sp. HDW14]QIM21558.1 oligosaccharide flippase family protein [Phycicoccus sp. HDW14]
MSPTTEASLRRPIVWTVVGNAVYTLAQWAAVAVVAKTLGPVDVGVFALAASVTAPVLVLVQMQLRIVLATDVEHRRPLGDYVVVRVWGALALVALSVAYGLLSGRPRDVVLAIGVFAVAKALDAVADVLYGYHQRLERMDVIARSQAVNGLASLVLLAVGVVATGSLLVGLVGFAAGSLLNLVGYVVPATLRARRVDPGPPDGPGDGRLALVRTALPLGTVLVLSAVATNVPRLVVEDDLGAYSLGLFAGVGYVVLAAGNVVNAVGNAIGPRLARLHASGDRPGFERLLGLGVLFGAGVGVLGALLSWVVGDEVLGLLYTDDYRHSGALLAGLSLASAVSFAASFLVGGATAAQRFSAQLPTAVVATVVAVVVSLVAVPALGLNGAVVAVAAASAVQLVGFGLVVRRTLEEMP